jgi:hypothetical protein
VSFRPRCASDKHDQRALLPNGAAAPLGRIPGTAIIDSPNDMGAPAQAHRRRGHLFRAGASDHSSRPLVARRPFQMAFSRSGGRWGLRWRTAKRLGRLSSRSSSLIRARRTTLRFQLMCPAAGRDRLLAFQRQFGPLTSKRPAEAEPSKIEPGMPCNLGFEGTVSKAETVDMCPAAASRGSGQESQCTWRPALAGSRLFLLRRGWIR